MSLRPPIAALAALTMICAPAVAQSDSRHNLRLTLDEQALFLSEMRVMLGSVQQIAEGLGRGDRALIIEAARRSGNRMARDTPTSVRAKVPKTFEALGGPTHLMFEELAIRAETDDMDQLTLHLANTMKQCTACHAAFRVR
jgi:hypothetical protein